MTERQTTDLLRKTELLRIKKMYEEGGFMVERILSQNAPNSLILFTEDPAGNERYIEIKVSVKKPDYMPDDDIRNYAEELAVRAGKHVQAQINKMPPKERKALTQADITKMINDTLDSF